MKGIGLALLVMGVQFSLFGQPGSSCDNPLPVICNKYMHIDYLFPGTLSDNGGLPCVEGFQEVAGIWLELNVAKSGNIAFEIIPDEIDQDIDFALFKGDRCNALLELRCVGGGPSIGGKQACIGNTGLRSGENDYFEFSGCPDNQNNYAAELSVISGESLLLFVHRFEGNGGFGISFQDPLLSLPNYISNAISCGWRDEYYLLEYKSNESISSKIVWTIENDSKSIYLGPGPHFILDGGRQHIKWRAKVVVNQSCICEEVSGVLFQEYSSSGLQIWPNPVFDFLTIDLNNRICDEIKQVLLIDFTGQIVSSYDIFECESGLLQLDVQSINSGAYIVKVYPYGIYGIMIKM